MKIYIGFSKPKNKKFPIFSWLIRLFERTPYSHVYIRWHSRGAGVDVCYEAAGTQLRFMGPEPFKSNIQPLHEYELEISKELYPKLLTYCMTNAGMDYGLKQAFGIALVKLFKLKKNPFADGRKSQVCSELVGNILQEVFQLNIGIDMDIAGPKDIDKYLKSKEISVIYYNN